QQGKSIKGFAIFEQKEVDITENKKIKEVEIILEDMFGEKHSTKVSEAKLQTDTENLRAFMLHSGIEIPVSALNNKNKNYEK
ncbi:MAG: hypothetical protein WAV23_02355, partial [Minisyncoccia bacterium]